MSAANPKSQEPSMEEILAYIRRIIADDQDVAEAPFRPEPSELAPPPHPPEPAAPMAQPARELEPPDELISNSTHAAVGQAFNMLAHTVLSSNARTLEDLVREMLRPMLKNWLDDNLPTVVERLVRAEIERVARGRR